MQRIKLSLLMFFVLGLASACSEDSQTVGTPDPERGKRVYVATCIMCHNIDPSKRGSQGPAIRGASVQLLDAKVLHKRYPIGHKPKRKTKAMPTYPQLRKRIPDIAAFLAQP
jgi:mono/diheme cytochrome c family protein